MSWLVATAITISLLSMAVLPFAHGSASTIEPSGMSIFSNEATYALGERVQINGKVDHPLDLNNRMVMKIFTPSGEMFRINEFDIDSDGGFTWSFTLPTTEAGLWIVNAKFSTREAQIVLNVLEAEVFDKVYIESVGLLDVKGSNITASGGRVGESVAVSATIVNDEQDMQPFMFIVQIVDREGAVRSMLLTPGSLQPKESTSSSVPWLPDEQGVYTAEIFVWSSLNGPTPLVEKYSLAFSINS